MNKEKNFASAVIYTRNAGDRIESFLKSIIEIMQKNFEHSEIICVNDKSTDNSVDVIKQTAKAFSGITITVVNLSYYHGVENAMAAGDAVTIGDFIFEFDSTYRDFSDEDVMTTYYKALQGYDVVSAVPDTRVRFTSRLFYKAMTHFSNVSLNLHTERFRVISRRVFNRVEDMNQTIPYRKVVYATSGLRTTSVKYTAEIKSEKNPLERREKRYREGLAIDSLILFTNVGYRLSSALSIAMMLIAIFMAVYCIVIYLSANPIAGWTTTVLFLAIAFFGLFAVSTVIIKYLQILVNLVYKRKQYTFESIEKVI